jgi:hypothetical protein
MASSTQALIENETVAETSPSPVVGAVATNDNVAAPATAPAGRDSRWPLVVIALAGILTLTWSASLAYGAFAALRWMAE